MIVIADTTPINHLALLGWAETLKQLYGRVIVPASVLAELWHIQQRPRSGTIPFGLPSLVLS
jgi:predicted nucleic acid-binding protein